MHCCLAVFIFVWVERIVMSSTYVISFILLFGGVGMSDVYICIEEYSHCWCEYSSLTNSYFCCSLF